MYNTNILPQYSKQIYILANNQDKKEYWYGTRARAEKQLNKLMLKAGLHITDMYDDKHFKTYICNGGVEFYISRIA